MQGAPLWAIEAATRHVSIGLVSVYSDNSRSETSVHPLALYLHTPAAAAAE